MCIKARHIEASRLGNARNTTTDSAVWEEIRTQIQSSLSNEGKAALQWNEKYTDAESLMNVVRETYKDKKKKPTNMLKTKMWKLVNDDPLLSIQRLLLGELPVELNNRYSVT